MLRPGRSPSLRPGRASPLLLAGILLGVGLTGCLGADGGADGTDVEFSIAPDARELIHGPVTFDVHLVVRDHIEYLHPGCSPDILSAHVRLPTGDALPLYAYGQEQRAGICAVHERTLAPGTYTLQVEWNGRTEAQPPEPHGGDRVPSGTYEVVAKLRAVDLDLSTTTTVRVLA